MNRLSFRLFFSFTIVLSLTICIGSIALLLVLQSNPVNTDSQYLELATAALEINLQDFSDIADEVRESASDGGRNPDTLFQELLVARLQSASEEYDVRIIVLQRQERIIFDTAGEYPRESEINFEREAFLNTERPRAFEGILSKGVFNADDQRWLFVEQVFAPLERRTGVNIRQPGNVIFRIIVAEPEPDRTVSDVIDESSGSGLFAALAQACCIGIGLTLFFSIGIVRWVSRPLNNIAVGAQQVAEGDYSTRVKVSGPKEAKLVATAFNNMAQRVEITQRAQRDFLANVSHDLRTPLTSIQGFAQAIIDGVADKKVAEIIFSEASRLNRMVTDLLDLARVEAGRMDMLRQAVEIDRLVRNVGDSLSMKAEERNIDFNVIIPPLPRIAGDGDRLAQVFTNLVDNAIKHTDDGGEVWLMAELDEETHGLYIRVKDTGEGIPSQDLPRIFERFYQVDKSRTQRTGTGLGLAITYEIIRAHNGDITVESEVGKGTIFSVWLPQPVGDTGLTVVMQRREKP